MQQARESAHAKAVYFIGLFSSGYAKGLPVEDLQLSA
jgi:hypothetical protein